MTLKIPVLILSGTVGVGKSTVLVEIHDVLANAQVPHACIERDALSYSWPPQGRFNEVLVLRNLAKVASTFLDAGSARFVVGGVVESRDDILEIQNAIPGADITVCRLTASRSTRETRLRQREPGSGLEWHLHRTVELDQILDHAGVQNFSVDNGDRPIREVACEVLERAGWPS